MLHSYCYITSHLFQERKLLHRSYLLLNGGMQRSTTSSTYPRTRLDTNALLIHYTGNKFKHTQTLFTGV